MVRQSRQITKSQNYKRSGTGNPSNTGLQSLPSLRGGRGGRGGGARAGSRGGAHAISSGKENDNRRGKKGKQVVEEEDSEEEPESDAGPAAPAAGQWKVGVGSDDDSEIDSDEAMGESDEEKFQGFKFGDFSSTAKSTKKKPEGKQGPKADDSDLDLESEGDNEDDDDEEGMMDFAQILDAQEAEEKEMAAKKTSPKDKTKVPNSNNKKRSAPESESEEEPFGGISDDDSGEEASDSFDELEEDSETDQDAMEEDLDSDDEDDEASPDKISALHQIISDLTPTAGTSSSEPAKKRLRLDDINEGKVPSEYNITLSQSTKKLSVSDILPTITDPTLKKSLNLLSSEKVSSTPGGIPGKLSAPLPKRQQARLDREAAYGKAKETLSRWVDTVKHNREAEHLQFPLPDPSGGGYSGTTTRITSNTTAAPLTALESTISNILQQSHLSTEKEVAEFEQLKTNKMSIEEVQKRTAQLRLARELLYREELKAKRIKKIKSKSYRRIHKKEREKQQKAVKEAMLAEGEIDHDMDDDERERLRAEERMSLRHKQSRWAKGVRESGRAAWDEDARDGAVEMVRRGEELRQRIMGKKVRGENDDGLSSDESENDDDDDDDDGFEDDGKANKRLLRQLERTEAAGQDLDDSTSLGRLMNMKFMKQAEAARKKNNEQAIMELRDELLDEEDRESGDELDDDEEEEKNLSGRRVYKPTPSTKKTHQKSQPKKTLQNDNHSDNEEPASGKEEEEDNSDLEITINNPFSKAPNTSTKNPFKTRDRYYNPNLNSGEAEVENTPFATTNPWLAPHANIHLHKPSLTTGTFGKTESKSQKSVLKLTKDRKLTAKKAQEEKDGVREEDVEIDTELTLNMLPATSSSSFKHNSISRVGTGKEGDNDDEASDAASDISDADVTLIPTGRHSKARQPGTIAFQQKDLVKRAFAGDDVVKEFVEEKKAVVEDDDAKEVDMTLPGWGSWTGAGISTKRLPKRRYTKTLPGTSPSLRKDHRLSHVIISEKRSKKNAKYLSSQVPFPFENRAQYEGSLRVPVGMEWSTKETFQKATLPRVTVKKGMVVGAMEKPLK